jgi:hypothetical protein
LKNKFQIFRIDTRKNPDKLGVFLTDYNFWDKHYKKLNDWCEKNNSTVKGSVVEILDEKTLVKFILEWS